MLDKWFYSLSLFLLSLIVGLIYLREIQHGKGIRIEIRIEQTAPDVDTSAVENMPNNRFALK